MTPRPPLTVMLEGLAFPFGLLLYVLWREVVARVFARIDRRGVR